MTTELCGHWEHEGACRWPHNSAIEADGGHALFRTLFVAEEAEEPGVRSRIEESLHRGQAWTVLSVGTRPVAEHERALAERLRTGPPAAG